MPLCGSCPNQGSAISLLQTNLFLGTRGEPLVPTGSMWLVFSVSEKSVYPTRSLSASGNSLTVRKPRIRSLGEPPRTVRRDPRSSDGDPTHRTADRNRDRISPSDHFGSLSPSSHSLFRCQTHHSHRRISIAERSFNCCLALILNFSATVRKLLCERVFAFFRIFCTI
jgi:hypothetical protein